MAAPFQSSGDWRPQPKQEMFLRSPAFEGCYGGSAGAGKSDALLIGALRLVGLPRYRALLLRREWKECLRTLVARSHELYPSAGGRWIASQKLWVFPSGAVIEIGHAENELDVKRFDGPSYQYLAFDELTHFTEWMYLFLFARVRSADGYPLRVRSATNPGGIGHDWVLERFGPFLYPGPGDPFHDPTYDGEYADSGQILYYRFDEASGRVVRSERWWTHPGCGECRARAERGDLACVVHRPLGRTFVRAFVSDNRFYAGTSYEAVLDQLNPVDRARLKYGNWLARGGKGAYFKRGWFRIVDACPAFVHGRVRYWDRAATTREQDPRAAFTAGVRMSRDLKQVFYVEDVVRGQWGPGEVEQAIETTADVDPPGTRLVLERDPGQAGKVQAYYDVQQLAGHDVHVTPPQGDKLARMKPVSAQAEVGNIVLVRGRWNEAYLRELEDCPEGLWDQIDGTSGAFSQLLRGAGGRGRSGNRGQRLATQGRMGGV